MLVGFRPGKLTAPRLVGEGRRSPLRLRVCWSAGSEYGALLFPDDREVGLVHEPLGVEFDRMSVAQDGRDDVRR